MDKLKAAWTWLCGFVRRWQEPVVWVPTLVVLTIAGWMLIGGLVPEAAATPDEPYEPAASILDAILLDLAKLPALCARAIAAMGIAYAIWRRWRIKLSPDQQKALWESLIAGQPGAIVAHVTNAAVFLACALALLYLFLR